MNLCRPRGLPIGNLTSQFWSNCYLHPLDLFIKRELSCRTYLIYMGTIVYSDSVGAGHARENQRTHRHSLFRAHGALLQLNTQSEQVILTKHGIPWLGFVIFPEHRRVKRRKVVEAHSRLTSRFDRWQRGEISFAEFDASVQGWVNHVRYADSWGLRRHVLQDFIW